MTKIYMTLAAFVALLTLSAAATSARADGDCPHEKAAAAKAAAKTRVAALDAPTDSSAARKIELRTEPIEQTGQVTEPEVQPADQSTAAPEAAAPDSGDTASGDTASGDAAIEEPAATGETAAGSAAPQTAKRICRKFSAAIAMVIEVPCE